MKQKIASGKQRQHEQEETITAEKSETMKNDATIAYEQAETAEITKTDQKIAELKSALLDNPAIHNSPAIEKF